MAVLLLKLIQPSAPKVSLLFTTRCLWILLSLIMMGHLIAGYKVGADSLCSSCSSLSTYSESFTIRNALPQANSNLHMVCSIWSDCGGFSTYSSDIPCNGVEVPINQNTCSCTSASPPGVEQVVCEFVWTKPNDEWFVRAQVLVWSRDTAAPKKTYYMIDDSGFWFSSSPDGTLSQIGSCKYIRTAHEVFESRLQITLQLPTSTYFSCRTGGNYLSSETVIMGRIGQVKGFGRDHCRTRS